MPNQKPLRAGFLPPKGRDPRKPFTTYQISLICGLLLVSITLMATSVRGDIFVGRQDVPANERVSMDQVNHSVWDQLLQSHVDANGMVNYKALQKASSLRKLDQYINQLSAGDPAKPASAAGKMAYWINAYNAVTIRGILREYPTTSIRNHTANFFGYNIWKQLKLYVSGQPYSLEQMEHKVLRKMGDPRIHFAIVCASKGCPRLLNRAYNGPNLERQLLANTQDFFRRSQNFRFDDSRQQFHLSSILKWFAKDFGAEQSAQLRTIAPWLPSQARAAARAGTVSVSYLPYDWSLNEQP